MSCTECEAHSRGGATAAPLQGTSTSCGCRKASVSAFWHRLCGDPSCKTCARTGSPQLSHGGAILASEILRQIDARGLAGLLERGSVLHHMFGEDFLEEAPSDCKSGGRVLGGLRAESEPDPLLQSEPSVRLNGRLGGLVARRDKLMALALEERYAAVGALDKAEIIPKTDLVAAVNAKAAVAEAKGGATAEAKDEDSTSGDGCSDATVEIPVDDIRTLAHRTKINLGKHGLTGDDIAATLPCDYEATTSKTEMWEDFFPEWLEAREIEWDTAHSNMISFTQDKTPGLFWDEGWGFMHRAMLYAITMLHHFAGRAKDPRGTSGYSSSTLRNTIEDGDLNIKVTDSQVVGTRRSEGTIKVKSNGEVQLKVSSFNYAGITYLDRIRLPVMVRTWAASADYHLWWAHRLHSHWRETGSLNELLVGILCIRTALAEIAQLGSLILHEHTHDFMNQSFHCNDGFTQVDCVQYTLMHTYVQGVIAEWALPQPWNHAWVADSYRPNFDRFDFSTGLTLSESGVDQVDGTEAIRALIAAAVTLELTAEWAGAWAVVAAIVAALLVLALGNDASCGDLSLDFTHDSFWTADHRCTVEWSIPAECSHGTTRAVTGTTTVAS